MAQGADLGIPIHRYQVLDAGHHRQCSSYPPRKEGERMGKLDHSTFLLEVAPLLVDMSRLLGAMEDSASFVVVVHDEDCKTQGAAGMRAVAVQVDAPVRGGNDAPGVLVAHPSGCALWTAVPRTMLELAAPCFSEP